MADTFTDFEMEFTVSITVKGSDYAPSDWDGDEAQFRADLEKEAREGMRNTDFDIADCWTENVSPPLT